VIRTVVADLTQMVDNSLARHAFQFVRALRKRGVPYDVRDSRYACDPLVQATALSWLPKVVGGCRWVSRPAAS